MTCLVVIPSRMGSSRFPGKPLCDLLGKPMVQWVYEAAVASGVSNNVVIATPDQEIVHAAGQFGAPAILTSPDHPSGTDRIAEVARSMPHDFYLNVQGDEPLIDPGDLAACARPLFDDPAVQMSSLMADCPDHEVENPAVVKVVTDLAGDALYFSRHSIPYPRNERTTPVKKHIGLYAYRHSLVESFASWPQTPLEIAESLEQLRFLEHGVRVRMAEGKGSALAVDTPEQAEAVRRLLAERR
ncbi:MAG: 3-deoxy-manno-octulosonate cytidylyltransferase [Armatimonadetes bacterium]|nr:3-deoxy-manno-octulosonate cytidylyltransferase [Armatimonadota bacterium]MBS1712460.1 3-deoxy-manno-octulosonate cytidylyltransferase [Armatimonadota bacterium]MBX3109231.1 3-deoxy-manno-octulosonate cytidylyltransferase [Fimbriimonadaceae bacterium]